MELLRLVIRSPGIAAALALSLLVGASALTIWEQYVIASDRTRQTSVQISNMEQLMADLLDAESSSRGYLLSGDKSVLVHFVRASQAAQRKSDLLSAGPTGTEQQAQAFRELKNAADEKLQRLRVAVAVARPVVLPKGISRDDIQLDEDLIARIRAVNGRAQSQLQQSLQTTRRRSRFLARLSEWVATFGCAGIFVVILFAQIRIQRLAASGVKLNEDLSAANDDLRQFVYSASHDLQEPLRVLMLYSDLVERNLGAQRPVANELGHLRRAAKQMSALLVDLVTYTQLVSEPKIGNARSDLRLETEKAVESLRESVQDAHAEISIGELPVVPMENAHALLLLQNLIGNSLQYRKDDVPPVIAISAEKSNGKWVISIADNGIGLQPAYRQQIFGMFKRLHTRTAYPGTGLGLAICRRIVERYGGTIWVDSKVGEGSTFRFSVPDRSLP